MDTWRRTLQQITFTLACTCTLLFLYGLLIASIDVLPTPMQEAGALLAVIGFFLAPLTVIPATGWVLITAAVVLRKALLRRQRIC